MAVDLIARALASKAGASANAIVESFTTGFTFKGAVDYVDDLPASGNSNGDLYIVKYWGSSGTIPLNAHYAWGNDAGSDAWIPNMMEYPPYVLTFNATTDWTAVDASTYEIVVSAATHQHGADAMATVLRNVSGNYTIVSGSPTDGFTLSQNSTGDITLTVGASSRFAGKLIVK